MILNLFGSGLSGLGENNFPFYSEMNVRTSSAIILIQYYLGDDISGVADDNTIREISKMVEDGTDYSYIMSSKKIIEWKPGTPTLGTDKDSDKNGHLPTYSMTRLPCIGGYAIAEKNTGIAWAMMVQGAIQYNSKSIYTQQELKDYGTQLEIDRFCVTGPNSGYRSYHYQVEAYLDWTRRGKPGNAAKPKFDNKENFEKFEAGFSRLHSDVSGGWNNIDDVLTQTGQLLAGYGTSNHGLGSALDLNFGLSQEAPIGTGLRHWVEDFGKDYGFWGLYFGKATKYEEENGKGNFRETWHLYYYGPKLPNK